MIKYLGDLVEKLVAGAFVVAIFQREGESIPLILLGLLLLAGWVILRRKELSKVNKC